MKIEFDPTHKACIVNVTNSRKYMRIKIQNFSHKPALGLRGYIYQVKRISDGYDFLYDFVRLGWPKIDFIAVDLPRLRPQYLNICYVDKPVGDKKTTPLVFTTEFPYDDLSRFQQNPSDCIINGAVITQDGYRVDFGLTIHFHGDWDQFSASGFKTVRVETWGDWFLNIFG